LGLAFIVGTFLANAVAGWGAKEAADVAKQALALSQRAWIRIIGIKIGASLSFREGWAHFGVSFDFSNVGNMPAINVMTHAKLLSGGGIVPDGEAQAFFDSARYDSGIGFGHTLFAGDRFPENGRGPNVIYGVRLRPEDMRFDDAAVRSVRIYVAACISYEFTSDPGRRHQTSTLLALERTSGSPINASDGVNLAIVELALRPAILSSMDTAD
jgi:hypothetical protein